MLLIIMLITPFILFIGGSYVLGYPVSLGVLYGLNLAIMYVVLWSLVNHFAKVFTQRMSIDGGQLILARKQMFTSFPILRELDLQIPIESIEEITLQPTRIGYMLTVQFLQDEKTMGIDLDINPLKFENRQIIQATLKANPRIKTDKVTADILEDYENKALSWRGNYLLSFFVIGLALVIFFLVSIYLGTRLD